MWFRKKKIPNPEIKEFDEYLDKRGLLLRNAKLYKRDIIIEDKEAFVNFAKRESVGTVFKDDRDTYWIGIAYFYIVDGVIVSRFLERMVDEKA